MKSSANVDLMFTDLPFLDRLDAARAAGFAGVEVPSPYDVLAPELMRALALADLKLVLIACPPPNYAGTARGFAAIPGGEARFRTDFKRTLRYARALGVVHINIMAGAARGPDAREVLIANLRWALAEAPGQSLLIEPRCPQDAPDQYLNSVRKAYDIASDIDSPDLGILFDVHHVHEITQDVGAAWDQFGDRVSHVQIAQSPARKAPDEAGDVDIAAFLSALRTSGYKGWVGGDYPSDSRRESHLFWVRELG